MGSNKGMTRGHTAYKLVVQLPPQAYMFDWS